MNMNSQFPVENEDWYLTPKTIGHVNARRMIDVAKTVFLTIYHNPGAIFMFNKCVDLNSLDWQYWNGLTLSYLSQIQYVGRNLNGKSPLDLLKRLRNKHNVFKTPLDHYLEKCAYIQNQTDYLNYFCHEMILWLKLSKEECTQRFHSYHQQLM